MPVVKYKPTSPGRRISSVNKRSVKKADEKKLRTSKRRISGRNNQGKITVRHRGGGAKRHYRQIDFKRDKYDVPGKIKEICYDPNRNANLALIVYKDGDKRYIIATANMKDGMTVISSRQAGEAQEGNSMPLQFIPDGLAVCCVEMQVGEGAKLGRAAGNSLILMGKEGGMAQLKMPSGEIRLVPQECQATIGAVGNSEYNNVRWGKAGRKRYLGIKPTVRGKAMNPVDHPHGGGEGNQPIGLKHPKTPWGKPAMGKRTRKYNLPSDRFIIRRRKNKKRK